MTDLDCILAAITIYVAVIAIMCFAWGRENARLRALLRLHAIDDPIRGEPQDAFANQHKRDDGSNDR